MTVETVVQLVLLGSEINHLISGRTLFTLGAPPLTGRGRDARAGQFLGDGKLLRGQAWLKGFPLALLSFLRTTHGALGNYPVPSFPASFPPSIPSQGTDLHLRLLVSHQPPFSLRDICWNHLSEIESWHLLGRHRLTQLSVSYVGL